MLTQSEIDAIKQEAEERYPKTNHVLEIPKREIMLNSYVAGATEERQRAKVLLDALTDLIVLKNHKDISGKDAFYEAEQPKAWKKANAALNTYNKNKPI